MYTLHGNKRPWITWRWTDGHRSDFMDKYRQAPISDTDDSSSMTQFRWSMIDESLGSHGQLKCCPCKALVILLHTRSLLFQFRFKLQEISTSQEQCSPTVRF